MVVGDAQIGDAAELGFAGEAEHHVHQPLDVSEQRELVDLRASNARLVQSIEEKHARIQKLEQELAVERQQNLTWSETMKSYAQNMLNMCLNSDPKLWETHLE